MISWNSFLSFIRRDNDLSDRLKLVKKGAENKRNESKNTQNK